MPQAEPPHSCPRIDEALEQLEHIESAISNAQDEMEATREINSDLRAWGEEWKTEAEELQERIVDLEAQIEDKDKDISYLESQVAFLKDSLHDAELQIV